LGTKHLPKKLIFGINSSYYPIKDRKMTAKFFVLALFASLSLVSQTGAKNFKTVKYEEKIFDNPDYKLYIVGSFSRSEILKIKIRVFNKSKNLIYIKPEEIQFLVNGEKIKGKGRLIVVQPNGDEARLIDVEGAMDMRCDKFEVILSGVYKIDPKATEAVKAEPTEVDGSMATPVTASTLFKCNTTAAQTNKEKSFAKYSCVYTGDKIGIIEPGNTVAIMASNKKNFNSFPKNEIFALEKGEPQTITIEFRKLNTAGDLTDGYKVEWNDVFKIGKLEAYEINRATINMDLAKSDK
jgi:hypothetical protein